MKTENNDNQNNKKQAKYIELGMCFGMLAGSIIMSILAMFGKIAWGGLAVGIGLIIGTIIGLIISEKK